MNKEKPTLIEHGQEFLIFDRSDKSFRKTPRERYREGSVETLDAFFDIVLEGLPVVTFHFYAQSLKQAQNRPLLKVEAMTPENRSDGYTQTKEDQNWRSRLAKMYEIGEELIDPQTYPLVFGAIGSGLKNAEDWQKTDVRFNITGPGGLHLQSRESLTPGHINLSRVYDPKLGPLVMPEIPFMFAGEKMYDSLLICLKEDSSFNEQLVGKFVKDEIVIPEIFIRAFRDSP